MPIFISYDGVDGRAISAGHSTGTPTGGFYYASNSESFSGAIARGGAGTGKAIVQDPHVSKAPREAEAPSVHEIVVTKATDGEMDGGVFVAAPDADGAGRVPTFFCPSDPGGDDGDVLAATGHTGGGNICFGDGSVRFAGDSPDLVLM
jgi:prepilin-type processing-associated H-X9-DG protein